jgi:hypothetical protein
MTNGIIIKRKTETMRRKKLGEEIIQENFLAQKDMLKIKQNNDQKKIPAKPYHCETSKCW